MARSFDKDVTMILEAYEKVVNDPRSVPPHILAKMDQFRAVIRDVPDLCISVLIDKGFSRSRAKSFLKTVLEDSKEV